MARATSLFYRLIGAVKGGETQTNFTPDNNYFVAPSVTYKPDIDTTLTILASASRNETRVQSFLPYVGTVVNAPFGRIPTNLFASDPSVDYVHAPAGNDRLSIRKKPDRRSDVSAKRALRP